MNKQISFERTVADSIVREGAGASPSGAVDDILTKAGQMRPMPRWLALIKEPPMRISSSLAVGSPMVRVAAITVATLLIALMVAGAGIAGSRLLAADGNHVVAQDGSGDFTTITEAVEMAVDGDTILVKPGTYTEAITITKDITLAGDGPREDIVVTVEEGPIMRLVDSDAVLSGFTFTGQTSDGVEVSGGAPTFEGLLFEAVGVPYSGGSSCANPCVSLSITDGSRAIVSGNLFVEGGEVDAEGGAIPLIEGNELRGGPHIPVWDLGDGAIIRNNAISGTVVRGIGVFGLTDVIIEGNVITNPGQDGLTLSSGSPTVRDNLISGSGYAGINQLTRGEVTLEGNELIDNNIGITLSSSDVLVDGNHVKGGKAGIVVGTGSPILRDNSVEGSGRGIIVGMRTSPTLIGNTACGNEENLVVNDPAEPVMEDNKICPDTPAEASE